MKMKRVCCLALVLVLMMTMSVPCLATGNENEQVQTRATSSKLVWDGEEDYEGNGYTLMGDASVVGAYGSVITSFAISYYDGGDKKSISQVTPSASTNATVVFYGLTPTDYTKLDKSNTFAKGVGSGQVNATYTFTASISMLTCTHSFWTDSGASGYLNLTAYPSDYT